MIQTKRGIIGLTILSRLLGLIRDVAAALLLPGGAVTDVFAGCMRLLFSHWSAVVDFACINLVYAVRSSREVAVDPVLVLAMCVLMAAVAAFVGPAVGIVFFGSFPAIRVEYMTFVGLLCMVGFLIAYSALQNPASNILCNALLNLIIVFAIYVCFFNPLTGIYYAFALFSLLPVALVGILFLISTLHNKPCFRFCWPPQSKHVKMFAINLMISMSQQAPPIVAHHAALALPGLASSLYFAERVVLLIPLSLATLLISNYMPKLSERLLEGDIEGARMKYRKTLLANVIVGAIALAAVFLLVSILILKFPAVVEASTAASTPSQLVILLLFITLGSVFWLAEMVALRTLNLWGKQNVAFLISFSSAFFCVMLLFTLENFRISSSMVVQIVWLLPIIVRATLMVLAIELAFRRATAEDKAIG